MDTKKLRNFWDNKEKRNYILGMFVVALSVFACYCVIWAFTEQSIFGTSTYKSYVLQAQRWLQGHLDLGRDYSYLEIAKYNGKFFISFPPIPSVILLPFCAFCKTVPDNMVATVIALIGAVYAYRLVYHFKPNCSIAIFFALFATIGGNFLHFSFSGRVWYIAQTCGFTFTMLAFYYAVNINKKNGFLPLLFLALAFGSRPFQIIYTPLILWFMYDSLKKNDMKLLDGVKKLWWWFIPALAVGVFIMTLNYARFGSLFEFGHNYLPEFSTENETGQFNTVYFIDNIKRMFMLPKWNAKGILEFPRFNGCAFWLISPIFLAFVFYFIAGIKKNYKSPILWSLIILIALHFCSICFHRTLGGSQFGNRYTVDTIPAVLFGIAWMLKYEKHDFTKLLYPAFFWGLCLNIVGTVGYFWGNLM